MIACLVLEDVRYQDSDNVPILLALVTFNKVTICRGFGVATLEGEEGAGFAAKASSRSVKSTAIPFGRSFHTVLIGLVSLSLFQKKDLIFFAGRSVFI